MHSLFRKDELKLLGNIWTYKHSLQQYEHTNNPSNNLNIQTFSPTVWTYIQVIEQHIHFKQLFQEKTINSTNDGKAKLYE